MKRTSIAILALVTICLASAWAGDEISFSGGSSFVSLQEGSRSVRLSDGARVSVDTLVISADSIVLEGDDYEEVTCQGAVVISDEERGLTIRTTRLIYDRTSERLLIPTWCEISDRSNELVATCAALYYDMDEEVLELQMRVSLAKSTSDGIMNAKAEKVTFDRNASTLVLSGGADVDWNGDRYSALIVTVDLEGERISLSGQIGGTVHG